ncbi:hypothetical protein BV898_14449 [Hypsibius exemplaris]|uniref:Uncharacterized protein n=1 Tax=Hypsibius exemplaris TaxID=2072580 RepID=A0A9X6NI99_HYPEX|nr:hypothetical protein BV898_14449 [Hypsibius exemplaris]
MCKPPGRGATSVPFYFRLRKNDFCATYWPAGLDSPLFPVTKTRGSSQHGISIPTPLHSEILKRRLLSIINRTSSAQLANLLFLVTTLRRELPPATPCARVRVMGFD